MKRRQYLSVPFAEKDEARELGAFWDDIQKLWYTTFEKESELLKFEKWIFQNEKKKCHCSICGKDNVKKIISTQQKIETEDGENIINCQIPDAYYCLDCQKIVEVIPQKDVKTDEFLLLIDGSSLLSTNYYGTLPPEIKFAKTDEEKEKNYDKIMQTSKGEYTNGVFATLESILKIVKNQKPAYLAIAFDKSRNTFRKDLYPEYKANRKETPKPLKEQFILMQKVLKEMGIPVFVNDKYEADDLIGTLAKKFEDKIPVVLYTKDSDYTQLVDDKVVLWRDCTSQDKADALYVKYNISRGNVPDKVFPYDYGVVYEEFGVFPEAIADLKGIMGDSSDNIPGVKGVSSAAPLLVDHYGSVEKIYAAIHSAVDLKQEKMLKEYWKNELGLKRSPWNALVKHEQEAVLSKELATIKTDIPMDVSLISLQTLIDKEKLKEVFRKLEIKSLDSYLKIL